LFKNYLTRIILIGFPDIRKPQGGGPGIITSLKLIFMSNHNHVMPWKCHFLNHHFTVFLLYLHFKVIIFLFLYIILKFIFSFLENLFWLHCKDFFTALWFLLERNCPHLIRQTYWNTLLRWLSWYLKDSTTFVYELGKPLIKRF